MHGLQNDIALQTLIDQVKTANAAKTPLNICGGGSKQFYGEAMPVEAAREVLNTRELSGISSHQPSELVVTARCGTPLAELEAALAEKGQCLPFEPPHFTAGRNANADKASQATVGGMVAAGLAGPSRAQAGSVRDYVLGVTLLGGQGEVMSFGGQVIKNVAGYDVSRLLAGSLGTLGVILEVSLKVLPTAPATATLCFQMNEAAAIRQLNQWGGQPLPLSGSTWWNDTLVLRLSGAVAAVQAAVKKLGGELVPADEAVLFWRGVRDHTDVFFAYASEAVNSGEASGRGELWRISVPSTTAPLGLPGESLIEWGGAQRWLLTAAGQAAAVRAAALAKGGHATLFRATDKSSGVFTPLTEPLAQIHLEMKRSFDPNGIFNPGRMYPGL